MLRPFLFVCMINTPAGCLAAPGYQISQNFLRTIGLPVLQPNALENSGMLDSGPFTRHFAAECGSVNTCRRSNSGVAFAAQTCAQPRKNRCSGVNPSMSAGRGLPSSDLINAS